MDLEDNNNPAAVPGGPEYTELGIKVMGYKFTMKLQRRASSASAERARLAAAAASETATEVTDGMTDGNVETSGAAVRRPQRRRRPRSNSRASTSSSATAISDTLRMLDLDSNARSRRPVSTSSAASSGSTRLANWEFQGFYNAPSTTVAANRTGTPVSSGYSSEAVSRTSSFSSARLRDHAVIRQTRLASNDDSIYSDVYSTINEELAELSDPFDGDNEEEDAAKETKKKTNLKKGKSTTSLLKGPAKIQIPEPRHCKTKSMTSLAHDMIPVGSSNARAGSTQTILAAPMHAKSSSLLTVTPETASATAGKFKSSQQSLAMLAPDLAPPLPMRSSKCRPPARPPYPSSLVRAVQEITQPLHM